MHRDTGATLSTLACGLPEEGHHCPVDSMKQPCTVASSVRWEQQYPILQHLVRADGAEKALKPNSASVCWLDATMLEFPAAPEVK